MAVRHVGLRQDWRMYDVSSRLCNGFDRMEDDHLLWHSANKGREGTCPLWLQEINDQSGRGHQQKWQLFQRGTVGIAYIHIPSQPGRSVISMLHTPHLLLVKKHGR